MVYDFRRDPYEEHGEKVSFNTSEWAAEVHRGRELILALYRKDQKDTYDILVPSADGNLVPHTCGKFIRAEDSDYEFSA